MLGEAMEGRRAVTGVGTSTEDKTSIIVKERR